jgi:hypothetical protein
MPLFQTYEEVVAERQRLGLTPWRDNVFVTPRRPPSERTPDPYVQAAREAGIPYGTVYGRKRKGYPPETWALSAPEFRKYCRDNGKLNHGKPNFKRANHASNLAFTSRGV